MGSGILGRFILFLGLALIVIAIPAITISMEKVVTVHV